MDCLTPRPRPQAFLGPQKGTRERTGGFSGSYRVLFVLPSSFILSYVYILYTYVVSNSYWAVVPYGTVQSYCISLFGCYSTLCHTSNNLVCPSRRLIICCHHIKNAKILILQTYSDASLFCIFNRQNSFCKTTPHICT